MKLKTIRLLMKSSEEVEISPHLLRGYFANKFKEYILLHQHLSKNKYIYKYPYIQYKKIKYIPLIIGIKEGVEVLKKIYNKYESLNLNGHIYEVLEKDIEYNEEEFGVNNKIISYTIITPWLALNENNYEKYMKFGGWKKRKELLESILVGNIISMSKSLGYTIPELVKAEINRFDEVKTSLKGTPMLGFFGTFSVNFKIPDYLGIGKSVSRGFGTVKRLNEKNPQISNKMSI